MRFRVLWSTHFDKMLIYFLLSNGVKFIFFQKKTKMFCFFLFALSQSSSKRHGRRDDADDEFNPEYDYEPFIGNDDFEYFEYEAAYDEDDAKPAEETIASKYLNNFDSLTKGQQYQVIVWALTELASNVDSAATKNEIEYEIGGRLGSVLNNVDIQDKQMKKQFSSLQEDVEQMKGDIDSLLNQTRADLDQAMKFVRKDIMKQLREIIAKSIEKNQAVASDVNSHMGKTVKEYQSVSTKKAIAYFVGFQILLFLCVYFYSKYVKEIRIE